MKTIEAQAPVLLLNMRRTGGTSIMNFIDLYSWFPSTQHEPLALGRAWGNIYREYQETGCLRRFEDRVCAETKAMPNIKHCFDVIELNITKALVDICVKAGYRVFLLTRRDEASRLKSLVLALTTNAWWKPEASKIYPQLIICGQPLPPFDLGELNAIYANDRSSLGALVPHLEGLGIQFSRIFYEDFFGADANTQESAFSLLQSIGVAPAHGSFRLGYLSPDFAQRSDDILPLISNYADICSLLDAIVG